MSNAERDLREHFRHEVRELPETAGLTDKVIGAARIRRRRVVAGRAAVAVALTALTSATALTMHRDQPQPLGRGTAVADGPQGVAASGATRGPTVVGSRTAPAFGFVSEPVSRMAHAVAQGTVGRYDLTLLPTHLAAAKPARADPAAPAPLGSGSCQQYAPDPVYGKQSDARSGSFCVHLDASVTDTSLQAFVEASAQAGEAVLVGTVNGRPAFAIGDPAAPPVGTEADSTASWRALYVRPEAVGRTVLRFAGEGLEQHDFDAFVSGLYHRPAGKRPLTGPI